MGLVCLVGAAYSLLAAASDENESHRERTLRILKQQDRIIERHDARGSRLEEMQDQALAGLLWNESMEFIYEALGALALPAGPSYGNEYTEPRFARLNDYESPEALTDIYLKSHAVHFAVEHNHECLVVQEPFDYPFAKRLDWWEVAFDNGEVADLPDISPGPFSSQQGRYCIVDYPVDHEAEPVALKGEFFTQLPDNVVALEFSAEDIGSTKSASGIDVTLVDMSEYAYVIEVNEAQSDALPLRDHDIVGEAISANGRYVSRNSNRSEPLAYYLEFEVLLDDLVDRLAAGELDEEQIRQEIMAYREEWAQEEHIHYKAFGFNGDVDTARVTLLARSEDAVEMRQEINASVFSRHALITDEDAVSSLLYFDRPVYDDRYILDGARSDYDSDELQSLIEVRKEQRRREYLQDHEYGDRVFFDYPAVASDLFIDSLERYQKPGKEGVRFFDAEGNRIALPADHEQLYRFMVSRVEYNPDTFPEYPARLEVTLPVQTAPDIVKQRFSLEALPEGIEIEGNALIIDHASFSFEAAGLESGTTSYFFAKDESERYLQEVTNTSLPTESGEAREIYYFYGLPESIEIWQQGEIEVIKLKMDTDLPASIEEQESALEA
ncbi:hypothetical protein B0H98_1069 [Vreelandella songnenensis]|uniref:Uncharacterized protein n=2 Tax=Vreelandella songnenensis TaxID=1176243 RepID=A0A2T0V208_9GAMM|nr:hypothetical protein B0H98_1069 [Halomonas songnenensis]